jgi:hypothetical protein
MNRYLEDYYGPLYVPMWISVQLRAKLFLEREKCSHQLTKVEPQVRHVSQALELHVSSHHEPAGFQMSK